MAKRGLGKGLSALIPSLEKPGGLGPWEKWDAFRIEEIPISSITPSPRQPRQKFDPETLQELVASILAFGVVQPIIVRPKGDGYEVVAGERRWRAARAAGLKTIPSIVRRPSDTESLEMALIENVHRDDLNAIEEAYAYQQLVDDFNITHAELSKKVGRSRSAITNILRLLTLPIEVQAMVRGGVLSYGHARSLLGLDDNQEIIRLAEKVAREGLSVRQAEEEVRKIQLRKDTAHLKRVPKPLQPAKFPEIAEQLSDYLSVPVRVVMGKTKGRIEIEFGSLVDLERIYTLITGGRSRLDELIS
jgi:ParB family chromosome partitioning protein